MAIEKSKELNSQQNKDLLQLLKTRFDENMIRHKDFAWSKVLEKLEINPEKLWSLSKMEETGGEPDLIGDDKDTDEYIFYDCSPESPSGRRSLCYDLEALESRKTNKPENSAMALAAEMGVELLDEEQYRQLQSLGEFDLKTSSWILTPADVRARGGALFGDRRYGRVFFYHNGAESYYAARGFRSLVRV